MMLYRLFASYILDGIKQSASISLSATFLKVEQVSRDIESALVHRFMFLLFFHKK